MKEGESLKKQKKKKDKSIKIRMTQYEHEAIKKKAAEGEMTVSKYMREEALGANNNKIEKISSACAFIAFKEFTNMISEDYGIEYDELVKKGEEIWNQYGQI